MEITMNAKWSDLRRKAVEKAIPFLEQLASENMAANEIERLGKSIIQSFVAQMYQDRRGNEIKWIIDEVMLGLAGKRADSKAETILYRDLIEGNVDFDFQRQIGPYRVDFLIYPSLVVELDGPHHSGSGQVAYDTERDAYLRRMGFEVRRITIATYAAVPEDLISWIKDWQKGKRKP